MRNGFVSTMLMIASVCAQPALVAAQTSTAQVNSTIEKSTCTSVARGYPADATGYPYSVARLDRALNWKYIESNVNVIVVDNGFLGYKLDRQAEDLNDHYRPSRNFPPNFFGTGNNFRRDLEELGPAWASAPDGRADAEVGHGTSIVGLVLGGMYDSARDPSVPEARNMIEPNVRALFGSDRNLVKQVSNPVVDLSKLKPWLHMTIVKVDFDQAVASDRPLETLARYARREGVFAKADIINMSLGRVLLDSSTPLMFPAPFPDALLVTAAGNGKHELSNDYRIDPASAPPSDGSKKMLVVASYDADGELSNFSNYGDPVTIAAPGCGIKSWIDGDGNAVPLSGTSMAAALTTFAAALTKSRWRYPRATAIRNRLITSARYNPHLENCFRERSAYRPKPCVRDGSALDIEAAVSVDRDLVEYRDCQDAGTTRRCVVRIVLGKLLETPASLASCMETAHFSGVASGLNGLTLNGSIKRIEGSKVRVFYEQGQAVGDDVLATNDCTMPPAPEVVRIVPEGDQLDGAAASKETRTIDFSNVDRVVSRSFAG